MRRIMAVLIILAGAAGGTALGVQLRPTQSGPGDGHGAAPPGAEGSAAAGEGESATGAEAPEASGEPAGGEGSAGDRDYVKIGRQIIIPVVHERETRALMLFELALDVPRGMTERAYSAEPRLRDAFLRELFEMSYTGAFLTTYTDDRVVAELRGRLLAAARRVLGKAVAEVLILDILRQEL